MGDRVNIKVLGYQHGSKPRKAVYLYSHWKGVTVAEDLRRALGSENGRARWNDPSYLARIIFDAMTEGHHGEETGFGIGAEIVDSQHPVIVVDTSPVAPHADNPNEIGGSVYLEPDGLRHNPRDARKRKRMAFKEFVALPNGAEIFAARPEVVTVAA